MLGEGESGRWIVALALAAVAGIGVPWLGMRMLVPALHASGRTVRNYRGRDVALGLGLVWAFWLVGVALLDTGASVAQRVTGWPGAASAAEPLLFAAPLVAAAFVFGLIDDVFGSSAEKGFRGHLGALARGRLSTGGLKLLGIGTVSLLAGGRIALAGEVTAPTLGHAVAAGALLALSANTSNLFDLRPGRALKVFMPLAAAGVVALAVAMLGRGEVLAEVLGTIGIVGAFCLGPLLAVWRFDLGEVGLLGDAGANAFGILSGALLVLSLGPLATTGVALLLLAVNLASERVSFSAVIAGNRALSAVDRWGTAQGAKTGARRPE